MNSKTMEHSQRKYIYLILGVFFGCLHHFGNDLIFVITKYGIFLEICIWRVKDTSLYQ